MTEWAALHVEHDDVPLSQAVLGDAHVVEREERRQRILEVDLGRVGVRQSVEEHLVALRGRLGQRRHQAATGGYLRVKEKDINRINS